jgi:hypothetical protein
VRLRVLVFMACAVEVGTGQCGRLGATVPMRRAAHIAPMGQRTAAQRAIPMCRGDGAGGARTCSMAHAGQMAT